MCASSVFVTDEDINFHISALRIKWQVEALIMNALWPGLGKLKLFICWTWSYLSKLISCSLLCVSAAIEINFWNSLVFKCDTQWMEYGQCFSSVRMSRHGTGFYRPISWAGTDEIIKCKFTQIQLGYLAPVFGNMSCCSVDLGKAIKTEWKLLWLRDKHSKLMCTQK